MVLDEVLGAVTDTINIGEIRNIDYSNISLGPNERMITSNSLIPSKDSDLIGQVYSFEPRFEGYNPTQNPLYDRALDYLYDVRRPENPLETPIDTATRLLYAVPIDEICLVSGDMQRLAFELGIYYDRCGYN